MPRERLRELLGELEAELGQLEVSARERAHLDEFCSHLRELAGGSAESDAEHAHGVRRVLEAVGEFEEQHPTLARFVTQVSDILARMGL